MTLREVSIIMVIVYVVFSASIGYVVGKYTSPDDECQVKEEEGININIMEEGKKK